MKKEKAEKKSYLLRCLLCGAEADERKSHTHCLKCAGPLDAVYDYEKIAAGLDLDALRAVGAGLKKYRNFFPIADFIDELDLQEGGTPLYHAEKLGGKLGLTNLFVKNEGANPTGVFKDRGSVIEMIKAWELGARAVIVASSGNMAASCAAYAARAGLKCFVLIPDETPVGKLAQMLEYGAHVIKIRGDYSDCLHIVEKLHAAHGLFLAGDYVFRREGQKSLAYEVCEQLDFTAPDAVIVPTGAGTNVSGIWKGFKEFRELGLIDALPKMIVVQADGCAVLADAFLDGLKDPKPWGKTDTVCTAVAVADPTDGIPALWAVRESGGVALSISDGETLKAQKMLAGSEAIFCETSSALAIAAIPHLKAKKVIGKGDLVVCVATGNGLKDPMTSLQNLPKPVILEADASVVSEYLKSR
jgi:threonine synthase